jgi:hypothetical protein
VNQFYRGQRIRGKSGGRWRNGVVLEPAPNGERVVVALRTWPGKWSVFHLLPENVEVPTSEFAS